MTGHYPPTAHQASRMAWQDSAPTLVEQAQAEIAARTLLTTLVAALNDPDTAALLALLAEGGEMGGLGDVALRYASLLAGQGGRR